jgi:NAD dependent epimerase/dehydratase
MAKLNGKKILVTGAGGFIGSHLTERLVDAGCSVRAFVRYNSRRDIGMLAYVQQDKLKEIEIIAGDLRDYGAVENAANGTDIIFHLGALIAIPYSYTNPRDVIETNVMGTLNILMAAKADRKIKKIIHTSTSEVYGTALKVPIDEKHPLHAQSPYSASKIGADKIVESFYDSYGMPLVTIRPFNTYGPRQSLRAVIPTIISQALINDSMELGSLTPRRDFTFVGDTVEGFVRIAESDNIFGRTINVGSNCEISIKELVDKIVTIIGRDVRITKSKERVRPKLSEVMILRADNRLVKRLTDWQPKVDFDSGLRMTVEWFRANIGDIVRHKKIEEYII